MLAIWLLSNPFGGWARGVGRFWGRVSDPGHWSIGSVILVVAAVVLGGLTSNLLATMIAEDGWVGAFHRNPRAWIYAVLVVGCAVTTTVVVLR